MRQVRRTILVLTFLVLTFLGAPELRADEPVPPYVREKATAALRSPAIREASGIAVSPLHGDRLWLINDSGGTADLHSVGTDGTEYRKVTLRRARNIDWEDLASFRLGGKPYLLVADTGDNLNSRADCTLYIVPEPAAGAKAAEPAWTIRFRYEDGPRDCESVAVDEKAGTILLISKRTDPPFLYELPLKPAGPGIQVARKIGKLAHTLPKGMSLNPYGSQPTGFDIPADGSQAALVTYAGTFLFPRSAGESWNTVFSRPPVILEPHRLPQAESIAFSRDGKSLHLVSEGGRSPIVTYRRVAENDP